MTTDIDSKLTNDAIERLEASISLLLENIPINSILYLEISLASIHLVKSRHLLKNSDNSLALFTVRSNGVLRI